MNLFLEKTDDFINNWCKNEAYFGFYAKKSVSHKLLA
jgi:hypothetical protein